MEGARVGEGALTEPARVPPAARERVVDALTLAYAEDRLTDAELEASLDRVYRATTAAEVEAVLGSLPVVRRESPQDATVGAPPGADEGAVGPPSGTVHGRAAPAARPTRVRALFSGQERALTGLVPRALSLRSLMGYVELDLTRATLEPGLTEIDVHALMGYVQIRLPPGVRVESDGHALFGFFALKGPEAPDATADGPVVRVTGRAVLGFAECLTGSRSG